MSLEEAFEIAQVGQQVKRIADVLTDSQKDVFVRLPGLQQYWPCGIRDINGELAEHGGGGKTLAQTGVSPTGYDGNSYAHVGNGINYFGQTLVGGITGLETYIDPTIRGLTVGCWFSLDVLPAVSDGIISKDGIVANRGYALRAKSDNTIDFFISGNGAALTIVAGAVVNTAQWYFLVGRFIPSTEVAIFVDGEKNVNTTAIPVSINISTQNFEIGRFFNDNTRVVSGKIRDAFICASALEDDIIAEIRANSQP